jgi:hypothetical protein
VRYVQVSELQDYLEGLGLAKSGLKAELCKRLKEAEGCFTCFTCKTGSSKCLVERPIWSEFNSGGDGKCTVCGKTGDNHHESNLKIMYCYVCTSDAAMQHHCCHHVFDEDSEAGRRNFENYACHGCKTRNPGRKVCTHTCIHTKQIHLYMYTNIYIYIFQIGTHTHVVSAAPCAASRDMRVPRMPRVSMFFCADAVSIILCTCCLQTGLTENAITTMCQSSTNVGVYTVQVTDYIPLQRESYRYGLRAAAGRPACSLTRRCLAQAYSV